MTSGPAECSLISSDSILNTQSGNYVENEMSEVLMAVGPSASFPSLLGTLFPSSTEDHILGWVCGHMSCGFTVLPGGTSPLILLMQKKKNCLEASDNRCWAKELLSSDKPRGTFQLCGLVIAWLLGPL